MVVKRVEMSQTAAAFGDDKLLIFLFIAITSPVGRNKATGKAAAFVYLPVVGIATRMRCICCCLSCVQCPEIYFSRRVNNNRCGSSWRGKFESCHSSSGPKCPGQSYFTNSALCD
ncbi:DNA polymerase catalytic subunit [Trichinella spiralis]|uniref:DNA polymerase catalytic subunit n=1 Tax=Trichinella spiralis TaxID=6334 RepID=A0ABR3KFE4_TRISP